MPHHRQKSINALPDFSFNPAGAAKPTPESSPPQSPNTLPIPITPTKPMHGHRRGGSEFIGGDVRPGGTALMSSSPTKGDDVLPAPSNTLRPGPPAGRRGHAHRRSGAISSHDLSTIMNPPAPARTGSAPSTPSEANQFAFGHKFNRSVSQPSLRENTSDEDANARPPSRARVTFSDRIETIRPLSTISSETEISTLRGHSAANSLSSIVGSSSPQPVRIARAMLNTVEDDDRPSTAGAVLDKFMGGSLTGQVLERERPMSAVSPISPTAPSPRVQNKRRSLFTKEPRRSDNSVPTLPTSASDPALSKSFDTPLASPMASEPQSSDEIGKPKRKTSRKPRKVKSWANSIITRKGKHSKKSKNRAPTPPPNAPLDVEDSDESEEMDFEPNFDDDTTVTIVSPTSTSAPQPKIDTSYASWQPRELKRVDSDVMSPVIDLDAALGPFNTPNGTSPRTHQRGFSAHRRAMHSASGNAPTHRRTESAPELVPFEHRSSAIATASPMADVFEEEEPEDDGLTLPTKSVKPESVVEEAEEPKISVVEADGKQEGSAINWNFNDGLGIKRSAKAEEADSSEPLSPRAMPQQVSPESVPQPIQASEPVEVVEDHEEPRTSSLTHSSDSTVAAQPTEDSPKQHQPVMNLSIPLPEQNIMTPDTVTSSFSSPDYRSSQISFDTRGGTAASSMTDYPAMPSPRFGEPGPEVRISTDVPSLTSSRSTMTSAMQNACSLAGPHRFGDRTASLCSDPTDLESRRRKRSSIASLSRLMGSSSYSERSKLSIEQRPQSEHREPTKDKKKKNLGSRLREFFRNSKDSKESSSSKT
jgi:hypothetical protein